MNLWHLFFIIFFFIFVIESGKIRPNFDEIFGDGWDKKESEQNREENEIETIEQVDQMGEEMGNGPIDQQKRETVEKFEAIKDKLREKGTNRSSIQKWKNELNLNKMKMKKRIYEQKKRKFIERFEEFKELYRHGKQKEFAKELGISKDTFWKWKKELVPNFHKSQKNHTNEDKLEKLKKYYEIKERNKEIADKIIAIKLGISRDTLRKWKKQFSTIN